MLAYIVLPNRQRAPPKWEKSDGAPSKWLLPAEWILLLLPLHHQLQSSARGSRGGVSIPVLTRQTLRRERCHCNTFGAVRVAYAHARSPAHFLACGLEELIQCAESCIVGAEVRNTSNRKSSQRRIQCSALIRIAIVHGNSPDVLVDGDRDCLEHGDHVVRFLLRRVPPLGSVRLNFGLDRVRLFAAGRVGLTRDP